LGDLLYLKTKQAPLAVHGTGRSAFAKATPDRQLMAPEGLFMAKTDTLDFAGFGINLSRQNVSIERIITIV